MMAALFACTKCHSRHPFEELTKGEQLCKDCCSGGSSNPTPASASSTSTASASGSSCGPGMVKCCYCRADFQQDEKAGSVCRRCVQDLKIHGKPKPCEYCNITAAFTDTKCSRCAHSEKKYGPPQQCQQCKQMCAFDRANDGKVHKLLCWLCTLSYKRVMEKAAAKRKIGETVGSVDAEKRKPSSRHSNGEDGVHRHHKHRHNHGNEKDKHSHHHKHKSHHHHRSSSHNSHSGHTAATVGQQKSHQQRLHELTSATTLESKRLKLDTSTFNTSSNGITTPSRLLSEPDPSSTDHVIALQQMRDHVTGLKKQLKEKDQLLMEKEKKLTELKANMYETEKEFRNKIQSLQRQLDESREENMTKNRVLQKQQATLSKLNKSKSGLGGASHQSTPTQSP